MRISDWSSDVCSSDLGSPLATAGVLVLLPLPGPLTTALVLMAAAPPILSAAPIAMILGLDGALALVVGLIATLLTPLTVPPLAFVLPGLELDLGAMAVIGSIEGRVGTVVVRKGRSRRWSSK